MPYVQVAALAEFRADWATAVKTYQAAYLELLRINPVGQHPLQRWTELTSVAEIMHLKVIPGLCLIFPCALDELPLASISSMKKLSKVASGSKGWRPAD